MTNNFQPSTQEMIAYMNGGLRVDTGALGYATYLDHSPSLAVDLFDVYGRILVLQLYLEVTSVVSASACTLQFVTTFTTPVIGQNAMGAACASISGAVAGLRIVHVGGAVATAAVITDSAGLSDVTCVTPQIVGGIDFVGTIGSLCGGATATTGVLKASIHYIPYSDGAYVEAA